MRRYVGAPALVIALFAPLGSSAYAGQTFPNCVRGSGTVVSDGVVISDFFSAYAPLEVEKVKCRRHLLSDSHDYAKGPAADSERARFHRSLHALYLEMGLALEQVAADPRGRERVYEEMRTKLWRFANAHWQTWPCQQLAARIKKYVDDLLVWLYDPVVEPTNARLLSLIATWERHGQDFFTTAHQALTAPCSQS
jgi:hypothetical protein